MPKSNDDSADGHREYRAHCCSTSQRTSHNHKCINCTNNRVGGGEGGVIQVDTCQNPVVVEGWDGHQTSIIKGLEADK